MKNPAGEYLRRFRVTVRFKNDATARRMTVAARDEKQAKRLIRAMCSVTSIESIKKYGYVLAPFAS